jgi:hypothetical protein
MSETRQQFIVSRQLAAAVQSVDALFSTDLKGVDEASREEFNGIEDYLAQQCSAWQLENAILTLSNALHKKPKQEGEQ